MSANFPEPQLDPTPLPVVTDPSGDTKGVYWLIRNLDDGLCRPIVGVTGFMQSAPNDPNRRGGHMYLIYDYHHSQTFAFTPQPNGPVIDFKTANPAKFVWNRSMDPANNYKRNTLSCGASDIVINGASNLVIAQESPNGPP